MTVAVCLKCVEFKHGAWTPCRACGFLPDDDESYTKHLLITDHYLSPEELDEVSQRIKRGETIEFPPDVLTQAWVKKADMDKGQRGCSIGCAVLLVAMLALIGVVLWWELR